MAPPQGTAVSATMKLSGNKHSYEAQKCRLLFSFGGKAVKWTGKSGQVRPTTKKKENVFFLLLFFCVTHVGEFHIFQRI